MSAADVMVSCNLPGCIYGMDEPHEHTSQSCPHCQAKGSCDRCTDGICLWCDGSGTWVSGAQAPRLAKETRRG